MSGVLSDHVGVNEIVFEYARRKWKLSSKKSLTGRKSSTSHASIEFCANVKSINSLTSSSVVGASRLHAFSNAILNKAPCRSTTGFQISHHRQDTSGLAQVLKVGTKLSTLVHDQNFDSIIVFEPELSQCGKSLGCCHVLPACSLVVTCPMTDDVQYSDWVFGVQRIPNFHRVDATNLIEAVTFRQSCCRPSSRHRSCFALWTFEITFHPSDDSPSAATISQGTTEFSNCWVPQSDVGSQQLSLL